MKNTGFSRHDYEANTRPPKAKQDENKRFDDSAFKLLDETIPFKKQYPGQLPNKDTSPVDKSLPLDDAHPFTDADFSLLDTAKPYTKNLAEPPLCSTNPFIDTTPPLLEMKTPINSERKESEKPLLKRGSKEESEKHIYKNIKTF